MGQAIGSAPATGGSTAVCNGSAIGSATHIRHITADGSLATDSGDGGRLRLLATTAIQRQHRAYTYYYYDAGGNGGPPPQGEASATLGNEGVVGGGLVFCQPLV